ncbi:hypothetical protein [Rhodococcus opacus]|uniref:hypothetical protein n=1 Tax=Rhodococcus opacus TaxID=37919 RepID=UPI0024763368|nr:hypothetical protein [Rhodococcus opacus]MDH6291835.1 hypothetical protein [Rhodococcus opacus]
MSKQKKLLARMRDSPQNVTFEELKGFCCDVFGEPRQNATSHATFKTPWGGDPRVCIQKGKGGKAKTYQVDQVIEAYDKLMKEADNA